MAQLSAEILIQAFNRVNGEQLGILEKIWNIWNFMLLLAEDDADVHSITWYLGLTPVFL